MKSHVPKTASLVLSCCEVVLQTTLIAVVFVIFTTAGPHPNLAWSFFFLYGCVHVLTELVAKKIKKIDLYMCACVF